MPRSISRLKSVLIGGATLVLGPVLGTDAMAAPLVFTRPNIATNAGPSSVTFGGQTFVNQGLQGVARLPATSTVDFNGDTFGAFSSLDVLPGTWRKTATGYAGTLYSLPDRGPNGIGSVTFSDFAGRTSSFSMDFTPYTGSANLPVSANSQHQLQLIQTGGFFFKDFNNNLTTGLDPGAPGPNAFVVENGLNLPGSKTGAAAGKIALDAEGLRFLNNGSFYVSDEYGANVYYFDSTGRMQGVVQPPPALVPRDASGNLSFTSLTDAVTGRRLNQGIEGMDVTPDSKKLVTLLQSATMQDSTTAQQTRTNTRLMIYDISQTKTPTAPIADYVVQLPIYRSNGDGGAADRTAAQSEILALNDTQFLVLSRDANGLGLANLPTVFKSVMLVDIAGATNIAGTPFENSNTPISPGGVLNASITPASQVEVVNILNSTQLGKFGINLNNASPTGLTLTEKWEGMALVPALDENAPQDYFLLIGNDNDFLSTTCKVGGQNCAQSVNSDAVVLVYRLTLPTYVDSQYLQSMLDTAPVSMGMTAQASREMTVSYDIGQHLEVRRHDNGVIPAQAGAGLSIWAAGNWATQDETVKTASASVISATVGVDAQLNEAVMVGGAAGLTSGNSSTAAGFKEGHRAVQISLYGAFQQDGFFADLTGTYSDQHFGNINRPGAYGVPAAGSTDGTGWGITGEVGYLADLDDNIQLGPVAGIQAVFTSVDGYAESGAAGGNILFPSLSRDSVSGFFGGEASATLGWMRAIFRLTYNTDDGYDTQNAIVSLVNASNAMGTQTITLPGLGQAHVTPSLTLTGLGRSVSWWVNYGANIGIEAGVQHHIAGGVKLAL
jgi:uncharacterized protein YhjY with autotransporter beta-barrel domain